MPVLLHDRFARFSASVLAFAAGTLATLSFAPYHRSPLAVVSLAVLFWLLYERAGSPSRAFGLGWCYGAGLFLTGIYWIATSIAVFGVPTPIISVGGMLLLVAIMALYPALFAALTVGFMRPRGRPLTILGGAALWTLIEWLRGWLFTGFPWLALGYSQTDGVLRGLAPIVGVYGLSFCLALIAAVVALCRPLKATSSLAFFALVGLLVVAAWPLANVAWTASAGAPLKLALVQGNVGQDDKWDLNLREGSLTRYARMTEPLWGQVDLIVWPETALPSVADMIQPYLNAMHERGQESRTDLLVGVLAREREKIKIYNALLSFGSTTSAYYKRHLVPFGEYIPLRWLLGRPLEALGVNVRDLADDGAAKPVLRAAGTVLGASICYEDIFGEEVIKALPEAGLLVNASNDAWFGDTVAPHQHLQMSRMRALETGRYLLRATNTGISAVIGPDGKIAARVPQFKPTVLRATAQPYTGMTPYARFGNWPVVSAALLCLVLAWGLPLLGRGNRQDSD